MDPAHPAAGTPSRDLVFPEFTDPQGMRRVTWRAMGTEVTLLLSEADDAAHAEAVRFLFEEWEATLSRFRPESELSRLNAGTGQPVTVSPLLGKVLTTALAAAQATGGVYDPTLLPQLIEVGYDRTFEALMPTLPPMPEVTRPGGGWRAIDVEPATRLVTLPHGIQLDFGGIAKGMAVDAAIGQLRASGVTQALVNAGGDLRVLGTPPHADDWSVAVQGKGMSWTLPLRVGAMATSGIGRRQWRQGDTLRHHLLNPATGRPVASGLWSVSVVADQCEQAEVAAKVAFIEGEERGGMFLSRHGMTGLFVRDDGSWRGVGVWPEALMRET